MFLILLVNGANMKIYEGNHLLGYDVMYSDNHTSVPEEPATSVIRLHTAVLLATDVRDSKKKCIFLLHLK